MSRETRRSHVRRTNVTACTRCRGRKIRCDQELPACSNCRRAGVLCVSTDIDGSIAPRSYMKSLEERVAYLENQLTLHGVPDGETSPSGLSAWAGPELVHASDVVADHDMDARSHDLVNNIALGTLGKDPFPKSVINRNGLPLLDSLLADPLAKVLRNDNLTSGHLSLLHDLPYETRASMPPKDATRRLVDAYFEHCDFFSPILSSKEVFLDTLEPLFEGTASEPRLIVAKFRALIVFATAVLLLNRTDSSVPISRSEVFFAAAIRVFSCNAAVVCTGDLNHLANLLLVVQHCCFCSNLTAAWHFLGFATRLAIELNLHDERVTSSVLDAETLNKRRWLFWSTYSFERNLCTIIGRPFSIPDEAIETPLPTAPDDDPKRLAALHIIKWRRLESEIYTTQNYKRPANRSVLDASAWRNDLNNRLREWCDASPQLPPNSSLAPAGIFSSYFVNATVLLHYPSRLLPTTSADNLDVLAESATKSILCYGNAFRLGTLRFYWRTVHNVFRSGVGVVYCYHIHSTQGTSTNHSLDELKAAMNQCSSVLWGMVERYPQGKAYRDIFENLVDGVVRSYEGSARSSTRQPSATPTSLQLLGLTRPSDFADLVPSPSPHSVSLYQDLSANLEASSLPQPAVDALFWGFNGSPDHD